MSDLFVGEALAVALLLPVLFRPFFRRLQSMAGIPVLPAISLSLCALLLMAFGPRFSLFPVFAFTTLVFFAGLGRLIRLLRGLPSDYFSPLISCLHVLLVILLVLTVRLAWVNRSELAWLPKDELTITRRVERFPAGVVGYFTVSRLANTSADQKIVVLAGTGIKGISSRPTLRALLAQEGWTVVEASFWGGRDYQSRWAAIPYFRSTAPLLGLAVGGLPFGVTSDELTAAAEKNLERIQVFTQREFGSQIPPFVVCEGFAALDAGRFSARRGNSLAGLVCVVDDEKAALVAASLPDVSFSMDYRGIFPENASSYSSFVLFGERSTLLGYGELGADDVLAARLLGGSRDSGRKQAEMVARRIATWLERRRVFHESSGT